MAPLSVCLMQDIVSFHPILGSRILARSNLGRNNRETTVESCYAILALSGSSSARIGLKFFLLPRAGLLVLRHTPIRYFESTERLKSFHHGSDRAAANLFGTRNEMFWCYRSVLFLLKPHGSPSRQHYFAVPCMYQVGLSINSRSMAHPK
jgi:hypothetical protein